MSDSKKAHEIKAKTGPDPENSGRRKAVKTIVSGVTALTAYHVMPTNWSKPIVEQMFLPAHAQTSGVSLNDPCTVSVQSGTTVTSPVVVRVNGFVTPPTGELATQIVATPAGAGSPVTANTTTSASGTFTADITLTGIGITSVTAVTTVTGASGTATCSTTVPSPMTTPPPSSSPMPN